MTDFVLNRSTWLTGAALRALKAQGYDPALYEPTTKLSCVVGLYLQSMGVKPEALAGRTYASSLTCALPNDAQWLLTAPRQDSHTAYQLTDTNDSNLHQTRKEAKIAKLFSNHRINVRFTGRYADATKQAKQALVN